MRLRDKRKKKLEDQLSRLNIKSTNLASGYVEAVDCLLLFGSLPAACIAPILLHMNAAVGLTSAERLRQNCGPHNSIYLVSTGQKLCPLITVFGGGGARKRESTKKSTGSEIRLRLCSSCAP